MEKVIENVIKALVANNMNAYYAETKAEVPEIVESILNKGDVISCGGSVTLSECGVTDLMKNGSYNFLDRSAPGLTREEVLEIYRKVFGSDAFLTSANAITENGELINVDGNGNRVSAICFGPKKVICIVGKNKIVSDVNAGLKRVKEVAAPKNAVRLNCKTPCREKGVCPYLNGEIATGCKSPDRLCAHYVVNGYQREKGRINVIICAEELGY